MAFWDVQGHSLETVEAMVAGYFVGGLLVPVPLTTMLGAQGKKLQPCFFVFFHVFHGRSMQACKKK